MVKLSHREFAEPQRILTAILVVALGWQVFSFELIWDHLSDRPVVLGRYSYSYLPVLGLYLGLTLGWLMAFLGRRCLELGLARIPVRWRLTGIWLLMGIALLIWDLDLRQLPDAYVNVNLALVAVAVLMSLPDRQEHTR
ncbi:MAG TPA: hypothetical protein VHO69_07580 [Phototrophicaceae bacterium]|nr:hypothetical protein [Phototrophicaceae bacterium]